MTSNQSRLVEKDTVEKDGTFIKAISLENGQRITGKVSAKVFRPCKRLAHLLRFSWKQATKGTF